MKLFFKYLPWCILAFSQAKGQQYIKVTTTDSLLSAEPANVNNLLLWYKSPAKTWTEALPIGNGRFGAMVFGDPVSERLQLNEITVWSGGPQPDADRKDAYKYLDTIRKAIANEDYKAGEALTAKYFTSSAPYNASYQTLGDINIAFNLPAAKITNYNRWLDIDKATCGVSFTAGACNYSREVFSSAADQVMVEKLSGSQKGKLSFEVALSRIERAKTLGYGNHTLIMTGNTGNSLHYEVQLKVINSGGIVTIKDNKIVVTNADEATILVTAATSYVLDYGKGFRGNDPHKLAQNRIVDAAKKPFEVLKKRHIADYQRYFSRVRLSLGGSADVHRPTDERLKLYGDGTKDPGFAALFYQYGRYLLISSSRPDNPLSSNAQGLWGDGLDMPWKCDYKSNINFEMNYWPAEIANLGDLQLPMINMVKNLVTPGQRTARNYYGPQTPGWYYGFTTNAWGWTGTGSALPWGVFVGGSGWACQHLWEHFAYGQNKDYLRSVYPTLKGAAEFYLATMVKDKDGFLITSPSTSPENHFITDKKIKSTVTEGATMEKAIIWDLFDNVSKACAILQVDDEFRKKLIQARDNICPLKIGKAGQLLEWNKDWDINSDDMGHRHVSHLFPLFPGHQIDVFETTALANAVKESLRLRGDDGTGWSIAWKENLWAKLRDGDHAHRLLCFQLRCTQETKIVMADAGGTYPNLFDAHPPFQIDGNFGAVSALSLMLLQNGGLNGDIIDVLPALPSVWLNGNVAGLKAHGGFEIAISWEKGRLTHLEVKSEQNSPCRLRTPVPIRLLNSTITSTRDANGYLTVLPTQKNQVYHFVTI